MLRCTKRWVSNIPSHLTLLAVVHSSPFAPPPPLPPPAHTNKPPLSPLPSPYLPDSTRQVVSPPFLPNRMSVSSRSPTMQICCRCRLKVFAMLSSMNSAGLPTVMGSRFVLPAIAPTMEPLPAHSCCCCCAQVVGLCVVAAAKAAAATNAGTKREEEVAVVNVGKARHDVLTRTAENHCTPPKTKQQTRTHTHTPNTNTHTMLVEKAPSSNTRTPACPPTCASVRCVTASLFVAMNMQPGFSLMHSVAY